MYVIKQLKLKVKVNNAKVLHIMNLVKVYKQNHDTNETIENLGLLDIAVNFKEYITNENENTDLLLVKYV